MRVSTENCVDVEGVAGTGFNALSGEEPVNVVPFPTRPVVAPPGLDLLGQVFAAMARLGGPASSAELAAEIARGRDAGANARIRQEVAAILEFYSRTPLVELDGGRVFRRIADRFAYTQEFRRHMALQGCHLLLGEGSGFDATMGARSDSIVRLGCD